MTAKPVPPMNTEESRAWGDWVATSEALYYEGQFVQSLPETKIDSMVADGDGSLCLLVKSHYFDVQWMLV